MISASKLEDAFPVIAPGKRPFGGRVMVQLRTVREKTAGGIVLVEDTKQFNKANTRLGKIVAVGPLAFRNRETAELWREGVWARVGDFVTIPQYGGSRFERQIPGTKDTAIFATFNDYELIEGVDPEAFEELDDIL
jgi:co-chaperonin GroES (HSP10)